MNMSDSTMERLTHLTYLARMIDSTHTQTVSAPPSQSARPDPRKVLRAIDKRSFATLSTASAADRPHGAGVLYEAIGTTLYVNTLRTSRKARNIVANPHVAVNIPIRRLPVGGPPSTVQFQGTAEVLAVDHPDIVSLAASGQLKSITSHGELENPDGCFLRITPNRKLITYGLGMSLYRLIRDPLNAGGEVDLTDLEG